MAHLAGLRLGHVGRIILTRHALSTTSQIQQQHLPRASMSNGTNRFWEPDKKGGYKTKIKTSKREDLRKGLSMMGSELSMFREEVKQKLRADPVLSIEPNDYEVVFKFDQQEMLEKWVVTTDQDHREGSSSAEFILGRNKTALFQGTLNTEIPKDGITKQAGYANIRSPKKRKSFQRDDSYDWSPFTHLVARVRGDGRPYTIALHMNRYFDVNWNDQYHYTLFTRGGPYWQTAKIPFSKFYLTGKGRVQDKQETVMNELWRISFLGITLADNCSGPFNLEIDYIGVLFDAGHKEKFAYEMYETTSHALG